jgi:hypothetical protein
LRFVSISGTAQPGKTRPDTCFTGVQGQLRKAAHI